jgi:hypothetical protein
MKLASLILAAALLTGCSTLVPKKVEFFQDKVHVMPVETEYAKQLEKQLVQRLQQETAKTVVAAVAEKASTNILDPAQAAARLALAESLVVGPPETPSTLPYGALAAKLETAAAKLDTRIEEFRKANDENQGKKIEGTGWFQVSYLGWVGGILALLMLLFFVGKLVLTVLAAANPGAALGLNVVNGVGSLATKGFSQLVKGGEEFKGWVKKEVTDGALQQRILDNFRTAQKAAQDQDVQNAILALTK